MLTRIIKTRPVVSLMVSVCILAAGLGNDARAQQAPTLPAGGQTLLPADIDAIVDTGKNESGESMVVALAGQKYKSVIRGVTLKRGNSWDVEARVPINTPLAKDDTVLAHFWARTIQTSDESGQGLLSVTVGETSEPWMAQFSRAFTAGTEWKEFFITGKILKDYEAKKLALKFSFGSVPQTIEIGGVEMLTYGQNVETKTLPFTRSTYAGRELDSPWRVGAEKRIQELRTAPFAIEVIDRTGKPVRDASVRVELKKHDFLFGCAVNPAPLVSDDVAENAIFRQRFLELFNAGSFINSLKWEAWSGEWGSELNRETTMKGLQWMRDHEIPVRGHVLVWPSFRNMPSFVKELKDKATPDDIQRLVLSHIDSVTIATAPYISEWDVINEPRDNHDLMDMSGKQVMLDYFNRARNRMPSARLVLNDYSILSPLTENPAQQEYEDFARYLIDNGAPIDGFGFQGHFGAEVPSPMQMLTVLDRFAALKRPIRVTEFDIKGDDDTLKSDFMRDFLTVLFSHASVTGFQMWGMEQAVRADGTLTPLGESFRTMVHERWKTDVKAQTNTEGIANGRGFLGSYQVTITQGGRNAVTPFELKKNSLPLTVTLP